MGSRSESSYETEATLVISSDDPGSVAGDIAGLTSLAGFDLLRAPTEDIRDISFDTPGRELQAHGLALRVRTKNSKLLITLKGPPESTARGVVRRLEIEAPWSQDALDDVLKEMALREILIDPGTAVIARTDPFATMTGLGFGGVQVRETRRLVRNLVRAGGGDRQVVAEMAIDRVTYHLGDRDVRHFEVEIEGKTEEGVDVLERVAGRLLAAYGSSLRTWDHSKLSTGHAISDLLRGGRLARMLGADGGLMPAAYDLVDEHLRQQ